MRARRYRANGRRIGRRRVGRTNLRRVRQGPDHPATAAIDTVGLVRDIHGGASVSIVNEATAAAIDESAARGDRHLAFLTLSTGGGAGVVADGRPLTGHAGNAAEVGHMTLEPDASVECGGGGAGLWEAFCGRGNLAGYARVLRSAGTETGLDLDAAGPAGLLVAIGDDPLSTELADRVGKLNAMGVALLVQAFDPARIVVGGGLALHHPETILDPTREGLPTGCQRDLPPVDLTRLGDGAAVRGALLLARPHETATVRAAASGRTVVRMGYTPHVLVIGGGAVGTGVARDLAIRGLDVTLVERGRLAAGTSGSMHALLHSGARYAVDDPEVAAICRRENAILRSIGADLVEPTGGLFASTGEDPGEHLDARRSACEAVGIPAEELDGGEAREREPALAADVDRAIAVPDAVVDPFRLCAANAISAAEYGATIRSETAVTDLVIDGDAIDTGTLRTQTLTHDGRTTTMGDDISPDYVVNASGPWADDVARMAGLSVPVQHSQGAMLVVDRGGLDTVVNRCRPRAEGDIAVPFGPGSVLGTTDRRIESPDAVEREPAELDHLVEELSAVVPGVARGPPRRAYWGVRALSAADGSDPTGVAREATVVDHEARDGLWGLTTVFGGKLTTHRATAERVADTVCSAFGISRACRTAELDLPPVPPADGTEPTAPDADPLLCTSQAVRSSAVRSVLDHDVVGGSRDLGTAARLTRAGMGDCQGGRCAHRLATAVDIAGAYRPVEDTIQTFLDDRWAGGRHAVWDEGAGVAMATYDFHARGLARGQRSDEEDGPDWGQFAGGGEVADD